jgi:hypothetical protein
MLDLHKDDDGRRILSGLEAFETHFAAVKKFAEMLRNAVTTSNQTSSRAFTTMEFTVDSETGSVAKQSVITITDEVGNESASTITVKEGWYGKPKSGSASTTSNLVNGRYVECEQLPEQHNLSWN